LQTLRHVPVVVHVATEFLSALGVWQAVQFGPHWVTLWSTHMFPQMC